jgi:hypothetical protein
MLYLRIKGLQSDSGNVVKHRKMLIDSIKKHLSGFQIKILEDISDMLQLENPEKLFHDTFFFEHSIDRFLKFRIEKGDINESVDLICRGIVETYEKIYHFSEMTAPLENLADLEINRLVYILSHDNRFFIGKLVSKSYIFNINIIGGTHAAESLNPESEVTCYAWRAGDAHYNFKSAVVGIDGRQLDLSIPESFERFEDEHHPLVDVNIDCSIFNPEDHTQDSPEGPAQKINGVIFKLNETELILRSSGKLEYYKKYIVSFDLDEYNLIIEANIIRDRIVNDTMVHYFNFKTINITPETKNIIRKHIENIYKQNDIPGDKGKYSR